VTRAAVHSSTAPQLNFAFSTVQAAPRRLRLQRGLNTLTTAAPAASGAAGWPSRDPYAYDSANAQHADRDSTHAAAAPPTHSSALLVHPLATALATLLLAARDAAAGAAAGCKSTAQRIARVQVWLGRPEALLFREGCQLLACMIFILLYVWRYAAAVNATCSSRLLVGSVRIQGAAKCRLKDLRIWVPATHSGMACQYSLLPCK
jgi:hypothetical protein